MEEAFITKNNPTWRTWIRRHIVHTKLWKAKLLRTIQCLWLIFPCYLVRELSNTFFRVFYMVELEFPKSSRALLVGFIGTWWKEEFTFHAISLETGWIPWPRLYLAFTRLLNSLTHLKIWVHVAEMFCNQAQKRLWTAVLFCIWTYQVHIDLSLECNGWKYSLFFDTWWRISFSFVKTTQMWITPKTKFCTLHIQFTQIFANIAAKQS